MKVTFLGTGAGRPSELRNTSSCFIEFNRLCVLVDAGEATQHQLLKTNIRPNRIDVICITHNHGDHIYGLPGLLNTMSIENRTEPVTIICNESLKELIKTILKVTQSYLAFKIIIKDNTEPIDRLVLSDEISVSTFPLSHDKAHCVAYRFDLFKTNLSTEKLDSSGIKPGPILGLLKKNGSVEFEGKTVLLEDVSDVTKERYVFCGDSDINKTNKKTIITDGEESNFIDFCSNASVLVHEATLLEDENNHIDGHSYLSDVIKFSKENKIKKLILNHISSRYFLNECDEILKIAKDKYDFSDVSIAYDFLEEEV